MHTSFGARLRAHRERSRIELAAIAERTKIKQSLLEALERDDVSRWPGGVFRRAYIRAYATAIGLDADSTVQEFLALYPDPTETPEDPFGRAADTSGRPPTRIQFLIGSAMSGLLGSRRETPSPSPGGEPSPQAARNVLRAEPFLHAHQLSALAELCSSTARAQADDLPAVLRDAARLLDAAAISLWTWDPASALLRPTLTYGYSREVLSCLVPVSSDADNALAAAFRTLGRCIVPGSSVATGAVVTALPTPERCAGVLAVEFRNGGEHRECECAIITILAAQLAARVTTDESARVFAARRSEPQAN